MTDVEDVPAGALPHGRPRSFLRRMPVTGSVPAGLLVVIVVAISIASPTYLSTGSIKATLATSSPTLLLAIGSTLVVLTGSLDLSIGGMAALASVALTETLPRWGTAGGVITVLLTAAVLGALQGLLQSWAQIPSFIVTLGGLGIFSGAALKISHGAQQPILSGTGFLDWLAADTLGVPNQFVVVVLVLLVIVPVLRWTVAGRAVYATGSAEPAARLNGIDATRVRISVFAASALLAALAACCISAQSDSGDPSMGTGLLLPTIAAVVVGGTAISGGVGGVGRAVVGGLIISAITTGTVVMHLSAALGQIVFGVAIIVAVAVTLNRSAIGPIK